MRVWRHDSTSGEELAQPRLGTSCKLEASHALKAGQKHAILGEELHLVLSGVLGRMLALVDSR
jgi:hypothetical protein